MRQQKEFSHLSLNLAAQSECIRIKMQFCTKEKEEFTFFYLQESDSMQARRQEHRRGELMTTFAFIIKSEISLPQAR